MFKIDNLNQMFNWTFLLINC